MCALFSCVLKAQCITVHLSVGMRTFCLRNLESRTLKGLFLSWFFLCRGLGSPLTHHSPFLSKPVCRPASTSLSSFNLF